MVPCLGGLFQWQPWATTSMKEKWGRWKSSGEYLMHFVTFMVCWRKMGARSYEVGQVQGRPSFISRQILLKDRTSQAVSS
jgi:hypothetical protein